MATFNESRAPFKPYGLSCERWTPSLMGRPDRHNEIELNYLPRGSVTYLLQDRRVTLPPNRLAIFWGLIAHQIVEFDCPQPYFVCTIPFSVFLEWRLPPSFVSRVLGGEVLLEQRVKAATSDEYLLHGWMEDVHTPAGRSVMLQEMHGRIARMALHQDPKFGPSEPLLPLASPEINQVERMAVFIGQNFREPIRSADVGRAVGLHPDYANVVFKKAFSLSISEYITTERIAYASQQLMATVTPITEIAFASGFNSLSRFNAAFRKSNRCTPRAYRKGAPPSVTPA
ncbi:helix-turn-helix domain-containing protein [Lewinella sp. IMCC34183]|uniref:helix-turn-helix domain-containing protein n=1 Tax=Lewinella sp. IMCC34183 TaxID=2248762 RepID=UPI000E2508FF|nr:helix-turn-helix domain-containing protein [Lewinella sp. IMCC34183]